ncbi:hypothetical protein [Bacillus sp. AFS015802]|uniref:hypothetical protein n=1 Tax=Bacillus sp. AFS015802 TaxID=2033486 RepID=UPI001155B554|nr:hypothetical protein [Bacillus sp. AFS015802]
MRRLLRKNGRAETPEAKLRRLGRSSAESEAVSPTIQHSLMDRASGRHFDQEQQFLPHESFEYG